MNNKNYYYVYVYLDPRKPGNFEYGEFKFLFEPYYIGKGQGYRLLSHSQKSEIRNPIKKNKINKILSEGYELIIEKVVDNLDEDTAYKIEKKLISLIGRIKTKDGPLCNIQPGGKLGGEWTDERRKKISDTKRKIGYYCSNNPNYGKKASPELKAKFSKAHSGFKHSEDSKLKMSKSRKGMTKSELHKQRIANSLKVVNTKYTIFAISPDNKEYVIEYDFKKFAKEHNISISNSVNFNSNKVYEDGYIHLRNGWKFKRILKETKLEKPNYKEDII